MADIGIEWFKKEIGRLRSPPPRRPSGPERRIALDGQALFARTWPGNIERLGLCGSLTPRSRHCGVMGRSNLAPFHVDHKKNAVPKDNVSCAPLDQRSHQRRKPTAGGASTTTTRLFATFARVRFAARIGFTIALAYFFAHGVSCMESILSARSLRRSAT